MLTPGHPRAPPSTPEHPRAPTVASYVDFHNGDDDGDDDDADDPPGKRGAFQTRFPFYAKTGLCWAAFWLTLQWFSHITPKKGTHVL